VEEPGEGDEDDVEGEEVAEAARWGEEGRGEAEEDGGEVVEGEEEHGQDNELRQQRRPGIGGSHRVVAAALLVAGVWPFGGGETG